MSPRKPDWLKVKICQGPQYGRLKKIIDKGHLHTVCEEALCPNQGRCWEEGRATIMILGKTCTRTCSFCGVDSTTPLPCDKDEPKRVAEAVKTMGLNDVVITSVTRDDLKDGGSAIWAETIIRIREEIPGILIEALIPDFEGSKDSLKTVIKAHPDILGHNLETVPSLYKTVRSKSDYQRSLNVLKQIHQAGMTTKTSVMLGVGETHDEVVSVMKDAAEAGCAIFFLGQYLQPSKKHLPVTRYVEPKEFDEYREEGLKLGLKVVISGPFVRSSYYSKEQEDYIRKIKQT